MIATALLGLVLAQAPASPPAAAPATVTERELGSSFQLRSSHFLEWRPRMTFVRGWDVALGDVWRVEIIPTDPRFSRLSLSVESTSFEGGVGMIRPRFEVEVQEDLRLGLEAPVLGAFSSAGGAPLRGWIRSARPGLLVSGRF